jgi:hypothetical protein
VTSNASVEDNRGKFAVAGLSLLAIAFPYYADLLKGLAEFFK